MKLATKSREMSDAGARVAGILVYNTIPFHTQNQRKKRQVVHKEGFSSAARKGLVSSQLREGDMWLQIQLTTLRTPARTLTHVPRLVYSCLPLRARQCLGTGKTPSKTPREELTISSGR